MATSLPNLVKNLSEGIHRIKCKYKHDDKKCETCELNISIATVFLNTQILKNVLIEYKCLYCNKNYQQKFEEKLKKRFFNTHKFSNMIPISLFYHCKKMIIFRNIWRIRKNSMKHHYLISKIFTVT